VVKRERDFVKGNFIHLQKGKFIVIFNFSFKVESSIEPIYTGGKVQVYRDSNEKNYLVLITGSQLHFRDFETGKSVLSLDSLDEESAWQNFLAHSGMIFTVNKDGLVESWEIDFSSEVPSKKLKRSWKSGNSRNSPVVQIIHHEKSNLLILAFADGSLSGWDSQQGYCTHNFKARSALPISALSFHSDPDRMELFVGSEDGSIVSWDLIQSRVLKSFSGHVSAVTGIHIDSKNKRLISSGRDKIVTVFSLNDAKILKTISVSDSINGFLSCDDNTFALIGEKGFVSIWDLDTGRLIRQSFLITASGHPLTQIMIGGNKSEILLVSSELQLVTLSIDSLTEIKRMMGHFGEVTDFALLNDDADGPLAVATNGSEVCIFPRSSSMACKLLHGHSEAILAVSYCPSGDFLVSGSRDNTLRIWPNPLSSSEISSISCEGHTNAVSCVAVSKIVYGSNGSNSYMIASASSDLTVKMWFFDSKERIVRSSWTVKAHDKEINALSFSSDFKFLITASQDKTIKIWDVNNGQLLRTLTGHKRGVWSISCTFAQEMLLVSGSADRTVKIWRLSDDFSCIKTFEGHSNSILRVGFINNGLQVVSAGSDGLIKIWDLKRNECLATLDEHSDRIWALAIKNDGDRIITGDASATIKIWKDSTDDEIAEAIRAQDEILVKEQELQVFLLRKDFKNAVILAMSLDQPFRLSSLFEDLLRDRTVSEGLSLLNPLLEQLTLDQKAKLIEYIREWNLSYKRSMFSQLVLAAILRASDFASLLKEKPNIKDILSGIIPYTEKHFERTDELLINSHLTEFALLNMN
jgi:U3 small nucleolar RNA-associated protein 13